VIIESQGAQITGVRGDPDHPANFGRLCTKGSTLHLTAAASVTRQTRLLQPMRRVERGAAPVAIGWDHGNFHWNGSFSLYLPTGGYERGQVNIGRNVVGFMPGGALTWFDPASGWDVSGALTFVSMTRNAATDYQSGDLLQLDWAIGNHVTPNWEIGLAANLVQQLNADSGTGAKLGAFKAQSFGLGPAVNYTGKWGDTPVSFSATSRP